jgi:uncharacterized membrane protein YfcA
VLDWWLIASIAGIGLFAGVLGGLLGVGGSTIMIPGLVLLFGQGLAEPGLAGSFDRLNQHVYQAAAMIATVLISIPATIHHARLGAIVWPALKRILPAALLLTLGGVWISNRAVFSDGLAGVTGPVLLGRVLAAFLVWVLIENVRRMFRKPRPVDDPVDLTFVTPARSLAVGACMGLVAGLTGLGGGAVAVPLQQVLLKLRLRNAIANSSAMICLTGILGSIYKNATLASHDLQWTDSLLFAALLAPTAMIGGYLGARLTHVLPVRIVRGVFIILLALSIWKMAAV